MITVSILDPLVMISTVGGMVHATPETISPVIEVVIYLAIIATVVLVAKGGMTKKAGAVGGWLGKMFSAGSNKFWIVTLLVGLYILILTAVRQLLPDFWQWLEKPGWFFFLWVVIGIPIIVTIVNTKQKFGSGLATIWLVITLLAADWTPVKQWMDSRQTAENQMTGTASTRSRVTTKTIVARPDEWSEFVWLPPNQKFWAETTNCVELKSGLGEIHEYCPGDQLNLQSRTLLEAGKAFRAKGNQEVTVFMSWEPK